MISFDVDSKSQFEVLVADMPEDALQRLQLVLKTNCERFESDKSYGMALKVICGRLGENSSDQKMHRQHKAMRYFCNDFAILLVDGPPHYCLPRQIHRASMRAVWHWLSTDLIPEACDQFNDEIRTLDPAKDSARLIELSMNFNKQAGKAIIKTMVDLDNQESTTKTRLRDRLGGDVVMQEAWMIAAICLVGHKIDNMRQLWPNTISDLDEATVQAWRLYYLEFEKENKQTGLPLIWLFMVRLEKPWQIMRLVKAIIGVIDQRTIENESIAVAGQYLLDEMHMIRRQVQNKLDAIYEDKSVVRLLQRYYAISRALASEFSFEQAPKWGDQILAGRKELSEMLGNEFIRTVEMMSEVLPSTLVENDDGVMELWPDMAQPLDRDGVTAVVAALVVLQNVKPLTNHIPLNDSVHKSRRQIVQILGQFREAILNGLRQADDDDLGRVEEYFEAAVQIFCAFYGGEQAQFLTQSGKVAIARRDEIY